MKAFISAVILLALSISSIQCKSLQPFIVGGSLTIPREFPFYVGIWSGSGANKVLKCGGVIININVILTSAGCLSSEDISQIEVVAGDYALNDRTQDEQRRTAASFIIHEDWNPETNENDIALIILSLPIAETSAVRLIALPNDEENVVNSGTIVGWGDISVGDGDKSTEILQKANLLVLEDDQCSAKFTSKFHQGQHFCAGHSRSAACTGDEGGPFIGKRGRVNVVYGVISTTNNCDADKGGALFTDISKYISWVADKVGGGDGPTTTTEPPIIPTTRPPGGEMQLLCTVINT